MGEKTFLNRLFSAIESRILQPFRVSWSKTIYFNLRSFPLSQAIQLPVYIYSHTQFVTLTGRVTINGSISRGMVRIGKRVDRGQGVTIIRNHGHIIFAGNASIMQGTDLYVGERGVLKLGENVRIQANVILWASHYVSIGDLSGIAYQSTITDSDFHYLLDVENGVVHNCTSSISIGKRNWIGSRTVIKKGTVTPDNTIVASSNSVLGKDYRKDIPEFSVIGGVPAKLLKKNVRRIFNLESENKLHEHFSKSSEPYSFDVDNCDPDEFCI